MRLRQKSGMESPSSVVLSPASRIERKSEKVWHSKILLVRLYVESGISLVYWTLLSCWPRCHGTCAARIRIICHMYVTLLFSFFFVFFLLFFLLFYFCSSVCFYLLFYSPHNWLRVTFLLFGGNASISSSQSAFNDRPRAMAIRFG